MVWIRAIRKSSKKEVSIKLGLKSTWDFDMEETDGIGGSQAEERTKPLFKSRL